MEYNECSTCGATSGRCGLLIESVDYGRPECLNCHDTRRTGSIVIHVNLARTGEELQRTMDIVANKAS